jgi:small multidrug resistance family-3 protein
MMDAMNTTKSVGYFLLAGLCEIGGGHLIWLWLREERSIFYAFFGAIVLVIYGVVPTLQPAHFGRVYAAYGGIFVALSILWGWKIDRIGPDRFDILGGTVALIAFSNTPAALAETLPQGRGPKASTAVRIGKIG